MQTIIFLISLLFVCTAYAEAPSVPPRTPPSRPVIFHSGPGGVPVASQCFPFISLEEFRIVVNVDYYKNQDECRRQRNNPLHIGYD